MNEERKEFEDQQRQYLDLMKVVDWDSPAETVRFDSVDIPFDNALTLKRHQLKVGFLTATQVGFDRRVVSVMGIEGCIYNPFIVYFSEDSALLDEIDVARPGLKVKIKRSNTIRVRYQNFKGEREAKTFNGLTARYIQQAVDQLDGVSLISKASRIHRERALRQWKRYNKHNAA